MSMSGLRSWILAVLAVICLIGCREEDAVTTVEVPRSSPRPRTFTAEEARKSLDHMLAAIVPHGDKGWFFKLVVPASAVEGLRKPFDEFIASIELGEAGATPKWKLPEGWVEKAGSEMRAATIEIPHGGETFELTVSSLPYAGELAPYVESNVNRWLGQLQQEPLDAKTIAKITRKASFKGGEATVVELNGVMDRQSMAMPAGHPPVGAEQQATAATTSAAADTPGQDGRAISPSGTGPIAKPAPAAAGEFAKPAEFTYTPPAGWQPGAMNSMRKAAFVVREGDRQAEVTVMPFPASGAMGDPQAQAERWAGQVGLGTLSAEDLEKAKSTISIDGVEGEQFDLFGPGGAGGPQGILAAMVKRDDMMWFFKMTGERTLVESQREAFAEFVKSIKFNAN